jgi:hypothetical protein
MTSGTVSLCDLNNFPKEAAGIRASTESKNPFSIYNHIIEILVENSLKTGTKENKLHLYIVDHLNLEEHVFFDTEK